MAFQNRRDAGRRLAEALPGKVDDDLVVLGLPRGGVPVAYEIALALDAPLDVIIVRKLGVPAQPELGMGAIGEDGVRVINQAIVDVVGVSGRALDHVERRERDEVERRSQRYRGDRPRVALEGRSVVIVDDGIATGSTVLAACDVVRAQGARHVVVATPVAPPDVVERLLSEVGAVVTLETPDPMFAIGQWYADFTQTTDDEVIDLLERAATR